MIVDLNPVKITRQYICKVKTAVQITHLLKVSFAKIISWTFFVSSASFFSFFLAWEL